MQNKRMEEKIKKGEAIDLSLCQRTEEGYCILDDFIEDVDYCDAVRKCWIWSIGIGYNNGKILASTSGVFYQNSDYECLWLR